VDPKKLHSHQKNSCDLAAKTSFAYKACNECGRVLSGSTLDNHQKYGCSSSAGPKTTIACPKCKRNIQPTFLQNHDLWFDQKFYKCLEPGCSSSVKGKLFAEPALKLQHSGLHEGGLYECLEVDCEAKSKKKFTSKGLQDHKKAVHMSEMINCKEEYCDFVTTYPNQLDLHVYQSHKGMAAYENVMERRGNAQAVAMFSEYTMRKRLEFMTASGIENVSVQANGQDNVLEDSLWLSEDEKRSVRGSKASSAA
jgi:hypothetical protein